MKTSNLSKKQVMGRLRPRQQAFFEKHNRTYEVPLPLYDVPPHPYGPTSMKDRLERFESRPFLNEKGIELLQEIFSKTFVVDGELKPVSIGLDFQINPNMHGWHLEPEEVENIGDFGLALLLGTLEELGIPDHGGPNTVMGLHGRLKDVKCRLAYEDITYGALRAAAVEIKTIEEYFKGIGINVG